MLRCLFEPYCRPPAATDGAWDAISVGDLDRGAIDEAVGVGQFHVGGEEK